MTKELRITLDRAKLIMIIITIAGTLLLLFKGYILIEATASTNVGKIKSNKTIIKETLKRVDKNTNDLVEMRTAISGISVNQTRILDKQDDNSEKLNKILGKLDK